MTSDERWYEAVKHLKLAAELLEGTMNESLYSNGKKTHRSFRITFDEKVLDSKTEEGEV